MRAGRIVIEIIGGEGRRGEPLNRRITHAVEKSRWGGSGRKGNAGQHIEGEAEGQRSKISLDKFHESW